jgi:hypothetical protein
MDLNLAGQALLKNLNLRREVHGEDVELGVDLRLHLRGTTEDLVHFGAPLKNLLYADGMELRMPYLKPLHLASEFKDHTLHIADMTFDVVTFSKFVIEAQPEGHVELAFNASLSMAPPECLPRLAELLIAEACNIDIEPVQSSLGLEDAA